MIASLAVQLRPMERDSRDKGEANGRNNKPILSGIEFEKDRS
jgi:hypothetical protein